MMPANLSPSYRTSQAQADTKLSHRARTVLVTLSRYFELSARKGYDHAWPPQAVIANETGLNIRTIERAIRELREKGIIAVRRATGEDARGNVYYLNLSGGDPPALSGGDPPALSGGDPTPLSGGDPTAPLLGVLKSNSNNVAAAETPSPKYAEVELLRAGVEQPAAGHYARQDPALAMVAAAHWRSKQSGKTPPGPGLLVRYCREPIQHGFRRIDGSWIAPEASARHLREKCPADSSNAARAEERARNLKRLADQAAADADRGEQSWSALDAGERQAIERAIAGLDPRLRDRDPREYRRRCLRWAERLINACADRSAREERWSALGPDDQAAAIAEADRLWPLFASDPVIRVATLLAAHDSLRLTRRAKGERRDLASR